MKKQSIPLRTLYIPRVCQTLHNSKLKTQHAKLLFRVIFCNFVQLFAIFCNFFIRTFTYKSTPKPQCQPNIKDFTCFPFFLKQNSLPRQCSPEIFARSTRDYKCVYQTLFSGLGSIKPVYFNRAWCGFCQPPACLNSPGWLKCLFEQNSRSRKRSANADVD